MVTEDARYKITPQLGDNIKLTCRRHHYLNELRSKHDGHSNPGGLQLRWRLRVFGTAWPHRVACTTQISRKNLGGEKIGNKPKRNYKFVPTNPARRVCHEQELSTTWSG